MAALRPVPIFARLARVARLVLHLFRGLFILYTSFPKFTARQRTQAIRRWSRQLLATLNIRVACVEEPAEWPARCMLVTNHVSWLDVFAILAVAPCVFVAKSEIRRWPLVGRLVTLVGTHYIERGKGRHAHKIGRDIADAIESGTMIGLCPEGTTTDGDRLLKFHTALFQPAIDARAALQPAAIRYVDAHGQRTKAASYVDAHTLVGSVWRIAGEPRMTVELRFGAPLPAEGYNRRDLARDAREAIAALAGITIERSQPDAPRVRAAAAR